MYVQELPRDTYDGLFFRAVLATRQQDYDSAEQFVRQARDVLGVVAFSVLAVFNLSLRCGTRDGCE